MRNERIYLNLLQHVYNNGKKREDRTGTGTLSIFGAQMRFNLRDNFPLLTTKKIHLPAVVHELLWFLKGESGLEYLQKNDVRIWNEWAGESNDVGPMYGVQWRSWPNHTGKGAPEIDQLTAVIHQIQRDPMSRRHVVSAWNVGSLPDMALAPCHVLFQFHVSDGELSCSLYQRSGDMFLGIPFNIASYALLTHMVAQVCGLGVGDLVHTIGDAHIYLNHLEQVELQLSREPLAPPTLRLNPEVRDIDSFVYEDIEFVGYEHHPAIKAKVAV